MYIGYLIFKNKLLKYKVKELWIIGSNKKKVTRIIRKDINNFINHRAIGDTMYFRIIRKKYESKRFSIKH